MMKANEGITAATIKSPGPLFSERSTEGSAQAIVELLAMISVTMSLANRSYDAETLCELPERISTLRRSMILLMVS